jgi:hypothetical protein
VGIDRLEQCHRLSGSHPHFLPGRPEVEITEVAVRAADVKQVDLRVHRRARAALRANRVELRYRELKQQACPEAAQRLGDDDPEAVQRRPVRENRVGAGLLAVNLYLERLDEKLTGDMHSCPTSFQLASRREFRVSTGIPGAVS